MKHVKLFENFVTEEKAKGDRGPLDNDAVETGLKNKAKESGVPLALLRLVMRRGMDAWNSGHRPGMGQEQWGYARVNAFLEKGDGTWGGADKDIAKEVRDGGHDKKLPYKDTNESLDTDTFDGNPGEDKRMVDIRAFRGSVKDLTDFIEDKIKNQ
jgi:hypothetical protein